MTQINARLSPEIRERFDEYSATVGLDAAELARLLIVRELHGPRPLLLRKNRETRLPTTTGASHRKLTAHFHGAEEVSKFDKLAKTCGFSRAAAAKLIFERELSEMWLAKAFLWTPPARSFPLKHRGHDARPTRQIDRADGSRKPLKRSSAREDK
jgi:hypothetical protein